MKKTLGIEFDIAKCHFISNQFPTTILKKKFLESCQNELNFLNSFNMSIVSLNYIYDKYNLIIDIKNEKNEYINGIVVDITKTLFDYLFYSKNTKITFVKESFRHINIYFESETHKND